MFDKSVDSHRVALAFAKKRNMSKTSEPFASEKAYNPPSEGRFWRPDE